VALGAFPEFLALARSCSVKYHPEVAILLLSAIVATINITTKSKWFIEEKMEG